MFEINDHEGGSRSALDTNSGTGTNWSCKLVTAKRSLIVKAVSNPLHVQYILVYPALDYPAPRLTGRVSLLLKGEKALSNKPPSFRFSAIVLMKVKLFNNLFC